MLNVWSGLTLRWVPCSCSCLSCIRPLKRWSPLLYPRSGTYSMSCGKTVRQFKQVATYLHPTGDEIGIVQLVLFGDMAFGKLGQLNHFGNDFLLVIGIAKVHQRRHDRVRHRQIPCLCQGTTKKITKPSQQASDSWIVPLPLQLRHGEQVCLRSTFPWPLHPMSSKTNPRQPICVYPCPWPDWSGIFKPKNNFENILMCGTCVTSSHLLQASASFMVEPSENGFQEASVPPLLPSLQRPTRART